MMARAGRRRSRRPSAWSSRSWARWPSSSTRALPFASRGRLPSQAEGAAMNETALLQGYLIVGALLFGIGLVGFISRRNLIVMFLAVEMMLQGVSLSLVAW